MTSSPSPKKIEFERNAEGVSSRANEISEALERVDTVGEYLMIANNGTASNAPGMPQIASQKSRLRITRTGLSSIGARPDEA
jgi:hypothetical protein